MAETICMANFKGGVGKSTTAVNVAACLARLGHRTLLVDVDPQSNASEMFVPEQDIEFDLRSVIAEKVPVDKVIKSTGRPGLDVLPASIDLSVLDKELVISPAGVLRIEKVLREPAKDYDYLVLDTGPNLSHLTLGALVAAQHLVIPVSAAVWSTRGLRTFMRWIQEHRDEEVIDAQLLGLVATMVNPTHRIGRGLLEQLTASDLPTFRSWIPRRVGAEDAVMDGRVAGDPDMDMSLSTAYQDLTAEIVARIAEQGTGGRHASR